MFTRVPCCVQLVTLLLLWPFSRNLYRHVNHYLSLLLWAQVVFIADWWGGMKVSHHPTRRTQHIGAGPRGALDACYTHQLAKWLCFVLVVHVGFVLVA